MSASSAGPPLRQKQVGGHVRRLRERARLSARALAASTGFSPSFISQLENGQVSPSIHSMEKIAMALGSSLGSFFGGIGEGAGGLILRRADRRPIPSSWSNAVLESLGGPSPLRRLRPLLITIATGGRSGKHPAASKSEEFAIVLKGRARLSLGPDEHVLSAGDSVSLLPGELRLWVNAGRSTCEILLVGLDQG